RIPSFEPRSGEPRSGEPRSGGRPGDARQSESRGESRGDSRGEPRSDDRPWGTIEALPGESLAKYANSPTAPVRSPEPAKPEPPKEPEIVSAEDIARELSQEIKAAASDDESQTPNTSARIVDPSDDFR